MHPAARRSVVSLSPLGLVALAALLGGCSGDPKPQAFEPQPIVTRSVPDIFRGTIGAEATIVGTQPVLVSGYGFVVGLHGTGGEPLPERVAATMERMLGLNGISRANPMPGFPPMSPRELLAHPDTAVVVVQAAIPPGAPVGSRFDVAVEALNATSLEGGRLWTTELRLGPPAPFGGHTTKRLGTANGDIFQNPFREPGSTDVLSARVMDGGEVTEPFELIVNLDSPSHARASHIASAINSRFPRDHRGPVARGVSDAAVALRVPDEWTTRPDVFIEIVNHLPIDWQYRREHARRYVEAMQEDPTLARDLSWCLVACNEVEPIRGLYESTDIAVLLSALSAGAELGDPLAAEPLRDLGTRGPLGVRAEAIRLLGLVPGGATVDLFLREQAASPDFVVRAAAYESLARRAEILHMSSRLASSRGSGPQSWQVSLTQAREEARYFLPGSGLQGIGRRPVLGQVGAEPVLTLDTAKYGAPLVYVTMHGQPKITLFGENLRLRGPLTLTTWDDRLMIVTEPNSDQFRLYFNHPRSGRATSWSFDGNLEDLIHFLARHPTDTEDRPGLGLSYSEIVNLLASLHQAGALGADFTTERDRLAGQILAATQATQTDQRPETPADVPDEPLLPGQTPEGFQPEVVPLNPPEQPR